MNLRNDEFKTLKLPRWEEFPAFELYIDQVIAFVCDRLEIFRNDDEPLITAAMINNYVKNGVLHPPVKKKYDRTHLAKLIVICISKRILALSQISDAIAVMSRGYEIAEGYNIFCDEVEYEVKSISFPEEFPQKSIASSESHKEAILRSLASAVSRVLVFDRFIRQRRRLASIVQKNK
jgi:hypothetical protein